MSATPFRTYLVVYLVLMALLAATWGVAQLDLGVFNYAAAAAIALVKAAIVAAWFMHLKDGEPLDGVVFGTAVLWLGVLLVVTMSDYVTRDWLIEVKPW
jgi:cytochrome c oxidase subunit 4